MTMQFFIAGTVIGKGRPRAGRGPSGHVRLYTPEKTASWENLVGWTAAQAMAGRALLEGPLKCLLSIEVGVPASWSMKKSTAALLGQVRPTTKPDLDNSAKAILDAMNGVVFKDDVQVVMLVVSKCYSAKPGVWVTVEQLDARAA